MHAHLTFQFNKKTCIIWSFLPKNVWNCNRKSHTQKTLHTSTLQSRFKSHHALTSHTWECVGMCVWKFIFATHSLNLSSPMKTCCLACFAFCDQEKTVRIKIHPIFFSTLRCNSTHNSQQLEDIYFLTFDIPKIILLFPCCT